MFQAGAFCALPRDPFQCIAPRVWLEDRICRSSAPRLRPGLFRPNQVADPMASLFSCLSITYFGEQNRRAACEDDRSRSISNSAPASGAALRSSTMNRVKRFRRSSQSAKTGKMSRCRVRQSFAAVPGDIAHQLPESCLGFAPLPALHRNWGPIFRPNTPGRPPRILTRSNWPAPSINISWSSSEWSLGSNELQIRNSRKVAVVRCKWAVQQKRSRRNPGIRRIEPAPCSFPLATQARGDLNQIRGRPYHLVLVDISP